jgi:hypothetical protein
VSFSPLEELSQDDLDHLGSRSIFLGCHGIDTGDNLGRQGERERLALPAQFGRRLSVVRCRSEVIGFTSLRWLCDEVLD